MKEKLLKRLPKKLHERVYELEAESGLIDNCKYMLYFAGGFAWDEFESVPCFSISEAVEFVRNSERKKNNN